MGSRTSLLYFRKVGIRNGGIWVNSMGLPANGYCFLHDRSYPLTQGDETCPACERDFAETSKWRMEAENEH